MDLVEIGYFSKTHGTKGQLLLKTTEDLMSEELKALFVEEQGAKAPFFVSGVAEMPQGLLVTLEDVKSIEEAKKLVNKKVFAQAGLLLNNEGEESELAGYELIDDKAGSLGTIGSVIYNGAQELLVLNYKGKEIMLPLVEEFIKEIDESERIVYYQAPEGLLDIYLE